MYPPQIDVKRPDFLYMVAGITLEKYLDDLACLGQPSAELKASGWVVFRKLVLAVLLILLGIGFIILLFVFPLLAPVNHWVFGISLTLSGMLMMLGIYKSRGVRILVYPEGMAFIRPGEVTPIFWDEIDSVWFKDAEGDGPHDCSPVLFRRLSCIILRMKTGKTVRIGPYLPGIKKQYQGQIVHLTTLRALTRIVECETLRHLLPRAQALFDAGETLSFGGLEINQRELFKGKESLAWQAIDKFTIDGGKIQITTVASKKWYQANTSDTPNSNVLRSLAGYAVRRKA